MAQILADDAAAEQLPALLAGVAWSKDTASHHAQLSAALQTLPTAQIEPCLTQYSERIRAACSDLHTAVSTLPALAITEPWFHTALHNLAHGCPVTAHLVEQQLRRGCTLSLADIFRMEWGLSVQCSKNPDFPEGVRAHLVDKDKQPRWQYRSIADVPSTYIDAHFQPPTDCNPLQDLQ